MSWATVSSRSSRVIRWYWRAELPFELRLLLRVELRVLDQAVEVVVQVRVDELQLRRAVLVEQRHRRAVLDRLLEVVDRDVIAEDLLGPLLAGDQRRAGEGEEERLRQRGPHVQRQRVVLAAVRLVGQHDHVRPVAEQLRRSRQGHLNFNTAQRSPRFPNLKRR